jgi:hypothetical protein
MESSRLHLSDRKKKKKIRRKEEEEDETETKDAGAVPSPEPPPRISGVRHARNPARTCRFSVSVILFLLKSLGNPRKVHFLPDFCPEISVFLLFPDFWTSCCPDLDSESIRFSLSTLFGVASCCNFCLEVAGAKLAIASETSGVSVFRAQSIVRFVVDCRNFCQ